MKCLIDGCDSVAKARGMCTTCYQTAVAIIRRGESAWEQLEELGLANKPQHRSPGNGAFAKALREKLIVVSIPCSDFAAMNKKEEVDNGE